MFQTSADSRWPSGNAWGAFVARHRHSLILAALSLSLLVMLCVAVAIGSTAIALSDVAAALLGLPTEKPSTAGVITSIRLPRALTALLAGAALGVAGLQMQTLLRNPLADPFVLGITSGASLGVALVVLASGSAMAGLLTGGFGIGGGLVLVTAATLGALAILIPTLIIAARLANPSTVLIFGLMTGYGVSAFVTVLVAGASPEQLQRWTAWGFGSFSAVTWSDLPVFAPVILFGIAVALISIKQLNAMLLGDNYARSMGVNTRFTRLITMGSASMLAGAVTAFCGPIGFLGVAVPHLARALTSTSDHAVLVPVSVLLGAQIALFAQIVSLFPGQFGSLPLNAVTALVGAPVVLFVILKSRRGVLS
ncbi:iron ABC transporter permease [Devosia sp. MC521]|uniref:FecCD family ABC transporter permease n=1 Tax=Devosia sp. MC521 TaxID=2759954 RepID=UPI0015FD88AF|nr:iron ABC transporter permease [Devosia sp. MC521]MBJ6987829.1 iron ABC transporter permease [Devosia sp. MC521]QMW63735.1 iron ABC transporter permease [Devosia sp. MC521]